MRECACTATNWRAGAISSHKPTHNLAQILKAMRSSVGTSAKCIAVYTMMHSNHQLGHSRSPQMLYISPITTISHCCAVFILLFSGEEGDGE